MALYVSVKFSHEEMPKLYDPGALQDLRAEEFIVVQRDGGEDVGFVACLEHKSIHQLKLRRDPYPRVIRRATTQEVEGWWERKALERRAIVIAKEKARELRLDIKISHVRYDMAEARTIFHFTSEQRVDFRVLVKELNAILKTRVELWQMGVRDEAKMLDGFGVCGLQTCCSSWMTDFRPVTIKMAKDQDINLPPAKLSGQCGRLLCCLSYEVDQYRRMSREALPKGSTVTIAGKDCLIVDRNLVAGTYLISEGPGTGLKMVKAAEIDPGSAKIPEQMKKMGRRMATPESEEGDSEQEVQKPAPAPKPRASRPAPPPVVVVATEPEAVPDSDDESSEIEETATEAEDASAAGAPREGGRKRGKRGRRGRGRGGRGEGGAGAPPAGEGAEPRAAQSGPPPEGAAPRPPREPKQPRQPRAQEGPADPNAPPQEEKRRGFRPRKRHRQ